MMENDKIKYCSGCKDDYYNGNNDRGIRECWELENAKLVMRKKISISQRPPWKQKPIEVLSCYHQRDFVFWEPDREQ